MHEREHTLARAGHPPIKFTGVVIGEATTGEDLHPFLIVRIYRTKGGKYVAEIQRKTDHPRRIYMVPDAAPAYYRNSAVCSTPEEVFTWLKEGEDSLGQYSQMAIEMACEKDEAFKSAWVEVVD